MMGYHLILQEPEAVEMDVDSDEEEGGRSASKQPPPGDDIQVQVRSLVQISSVSWPFML